MSLRRNSLQLEQLEGRELYAVNALDTSALGSGPVEVADVRILQDTRDVGVVAEQMENASTILAGLRAEVLAAEAALTALGPVQVPTLRPDGADRRILEHTTLTMGGQTAEAWTGWERHGVLVRDGSLVTVGSSSGSMTTVEQPQGTDNIALRFTTPQTDLRAVRLRPLVAGQNMTGEAWVITSTGTVIKSNFSSINSGSVPLPVHNSVSYVVVVWRSGGGYSLEAIERAAPVDPVRMAAEQRVTTARANEQAGIANLQPDALRVRLREELSDVVFGAAQFGVSVPSTVSSGQELVSVTPTAQAWAPNSVELAFRFTDLAGSYDLLQNGSVKVRFNPGTSTLHIPYDGSASLGGWSLRSVATGATTSLDLLVTRNVQSGVFSFLRQSNSQAYGTQAIAALTGLVARPIITAERFNMGGVSPTTQSAINALLGSDLSWLQNVPLTASELSAGRDRWTVGTVQDETRARAAFLARPGVEAVVTPSLSFQSGWNMTGQHTLTVNGHDLPEGSRIVLASDAGLTQVVDERSVLSGSDSATFLRGSATFVGLVDASGQLLGQPFTLANENGWLMVRQGGTLVGQPNTTLPATALAGVLTPVTKDSLRSVAPSVRFVVSGSSVDLRYEWLPVGTVVTLTNPVDGVTSPPITVTSRTGNLPLYLPAGQARRITLTASDGRQLFRPMGIIRRPDTGQMSFYELEPPTNRWVSALELTTERTLATREDVRTTEAGRTTLTPRLNAVSISADTTSRRNWGAALGELAGISLSLSEREIARRHLPNLIGATPAEDCTLILAEIDRLTALPGSNSRGWNERFVLSQVSDAYARAREDIKLAWPIFCEMIVAGFQVVQSTRTDVANVTPVSAIDQMRTFYPQSAQILHLLPNSQTILSCLNQHFDRCHTFLAGAAATWQQEVNEASAAGRITRDPNPGLRLPDSPLQRAYDVVLSALGDAERLHRQAVSTGVARYISAAVVTLEKARVTLQQAEAALRGTTTATTPAQLTKQTLENGDIITVMNKTSLQYILAGLPGKVASTQQRLQVVTSATVRASLQAELVHWQTLQTAAQGLLALVPIGGTVPNVSTTQAREWAAYIERTTTDPGDLRAIIESTNGKANWVGANTAAGRVALYLGEVLLPEFTQTVRTPSLQPFRSTFLKVEELTGIASSSVESAMATALNSLPLSATSATRKQVLADAIRALFIKAQYGSAVGAGTAEAHPNKILGGTASDGSPLSLTQTTYQMGETIRLRLDAPLQANNTPRIATIYLTDASGKRLSGVLPLQASSGVIQYEISTQEIAELSGQSTFGFEVVFDGVGSVKSDLITIETPTFANIRNYLSTHPEFVNHLTSVLESAEDATTFLQWMKDNIHQLADDYVQRGETVSVEEYLVKWATDLGGGLIDFASASVSVSQSSVSFQAGSVMMVRYDWSGTELVRRTKDVLRCIPIVSIPFLASDIFERVSDWQLTTDEGLATAFDLASIAGDTLIIGRAFSTPAKGLASLLRSGGALKTAENITEVVIDIPGVAGRLRAIKNVTGAAANAVLDSETLVKIRHIMMGEIKNGQAHGGHLLEAIDAGFIRVRPGTSITTNATTGVQQASIDVWDSVTNTWKQKNAPSTFFPPSWNASNFSEKLLQAWNTKKRERGEAQWRATVDGITVVITFAGDKITSAYPIL